LTFFGDHSGLSGADAFAAYLAPLRRTRWFVYAKRPFAGPGAVLAYLSRYTHRVALSNRRLIAADGHRVTFRYKDYRRDGSDRFKTMTLSPHEFIRRFLIHVLPKGFHRIRHYGLFASAERQRNIAQARQLLGVPAPEPQVEDVDGAERASKRLAPACPCCGGRMVIIETFERGGTPRYHSTVPTRIVRIDTS
jgi:Putative transposase